MIFKQKTEILLLKNNICFKLITPQKTYSVLKILFIFDFKISLPLCYQPNHIEVTHTPQRLSCF